MKIEAITTCVGYGDYLAESLPRNLPHFDRMLVITSPEDRETQEVCRRHSVPFYATDLFTAHGTSFAKSRGIDFGMAFIRWGDWICHLDADTVLPPLARVHLERMREVGRLDPDSIYGIDRVNCVGWDRWKAHCAEAHTGHDYMCRVKFPLDMAIGHRISLHEYGGFMPIGYMQLWHAKHGRRYPVASGTAERDDVLHPMQWPATKRHLIPEIIGVHLMAEESPLGANWEGRTTPRFGPRSKPGNSDGSPS